MSKYVPVITIDPYEGNSNFCIVNIHEIHFSDVIFSFNISYLFDYVLDEHKTWFLEEVFSKKVIQIWNVDKDSISWDANNFNSLIEQMRKIHLT